MRQAVLLLAHGAPERLEDIPAYLSLVRGGRPPSEEITHEVTRRYAEIGGSSPLLQRTREQAEALQRELGIPVYFAMRNWHPLINETVAKVKADGIDHVVAVCLAPQYSEMSVGFYFRRTQEAKEALGYKGDIAWTKSFHNHPRLIDAFYEKLAPLLPSGRIIFTAHSLPARILENRDPYDDEVKVTARAVALRAGLSSWEFAYQSQGMTSEVWLGPTVEERLDDCAACNITDVVVAPIGFVSDHVEILYDVDIQFRDYARRLGITVRRPESLNDSPTFIAALAAVVREKLADA
jgi:ferrochelatase